jgi:DNA-binding NarL/FixJ family response regulator
VSELLAEELANSLLGGREAAPHDSLSAREFQIFLKLASGRTIAEIAEELCLSVKTVSTYRSRILQALTLSNNAELTGYALRNTLIQ